MQSTLPVFSPHAYRIDETYPELSDTVTLKCSPLNEPRPSCEPGQFNMLYAFGVGEIAISISDTDDESSQFVHTVRNVGHVSQALAQARVGDTIGLRGPFGRGWPMSEAVGQDVVIVAGGLGLAPLRPVISEVLRSPERYGHLTILVGSRHPTDLLYRESLRDWRQNLDLDIEVTVDHADSGWHGNVGVVPALIPKANFNRQRTLAMVCGPEVMMRYTVNALWDAGLKSEQIYLSMERNMKCAVGLCGHCQFGPTFICRDGPVIRFDRIEEIFKVREI